MFPFINILRHLLSIKTNNLHIFNNKMNKKINQIQYSESFFGYLAGVFSPLTYNTSSTSSIISSDLNFEVKDQRINNIKYVTNLK